MRKGGCEHPPYIYIVLTALTLAVLSTNHLAACPFCPTVEPTFAERRETADWTALVEVIECNGDNCRARVRQRLGGDTPDVDVTVDLATVSKHPVGTLLLTLREPDDVGMLSVGPVDETSYAYFYRSPTLRRPARERLRYFADYLEHPDPMIAADAFAEFARADYDDVAAVADAFDMQAVRHWLIDADVSERRKGFYGLVLGLAGDDNDRAANADLLKELLLADEGDFRAGFDGLLAGYLLLEKTAALDLIDRRCLEPGADDRPGDTRHAMAALRFYQQYGHHIPPERLRASMRLLLERPEFAAAAIVDLARWQDWSALDEVVACWDTSNDELRPATSRAVVGYLIANPNPVAKVQLRRLRKESPDRVAAAERFLELFGGVLPAARAE